MDNIWTNNTISVLQNSLRFIKLKLISLVSASYHYSAIMPFSTDFYLFY